MSEKVQSGGGSGSGGFDLKKFIAEAIGTACLTFLACGGALNSGMAPFSFGFTIMSMVYLIGNISGCHINPAVSLCMLIRKKMSPCEFGVYCGAQCLGAIVGSFLLGLCTRGRWGNLCSNYITDTLRSDKLDDKLKRKKDAWYYIDGILIEIILTFIFVLVVQVATDTKYHDGKHAGIVIGLALAAVHFFGCKYTNTSVNPARSLGPALLEWFEKGKYEEILTYQEENPNDFAIKQIWVFIIGPMAGGALSGLAYGPLFG